MEYIWLTQGYIAIVDDEDYEQVISYGKWQAHVGPTTVYATKILKGTKKRIWLHDVIMKPIPPLTVDHIDKDALNCQKTNMRLATKSQQNANRRSVMTNGYRGIYPVNESYKWEPRLWFQGKLYRNGTYYTKEEAARAYDELARKIYGQFATVNFS